MLPTPVGKERGIVVFIVLAAAMGLLAALLAVIVFGDTTPTGLAVLLGVAIVTLVVTGIMVLVRTWKVHSEVYRQFELEREERKKGTLWFVLGIVLAGPFMLAYGWIWVSNLQHVRRRLGLPGGITPGNFVALHLASNVGIVAVNIWIRILLAPYGEDEALPPAIVDQLRVALMVFIGLFVVGAVLSTLAWVRVQQDTNAVWRSDWRRYAPGPGMAPLGTQPPVGARLATGSPTMVAAPPGTAARPLAGGARRLLCPRCKTPVTVAPGAKPACPSCGFGSP